MTSDEMMLSYYPCIKYETCQKDKTYRGVCTYCRDNLKVILHAVKQWNFRDESDGLLFLEEP
jgi:hypothetical protein